MTQSNQLKRTQDLDARLKLRLATIAEVCASNPFLKQGTIRSWIQLNPDGFVDECVHRIFGRLYLKLDDLEAWLLRQRGRTTDEDWDGYDD